MGRSLLHEKKAYIMIMTIFLIDGGILRISEEDLGSMSDHYTEKTGAEMLIGIF